MAAAGFGPIEARPLAVAAVVMTFAASAATAFAQNASSDAAPYCADLKRVAALASTANRFASIIGRPRDGNFSDTVLPLTGWSDCAIYGTRMYTCDSQALKNAEEAEKAQAQTVDHVLSCFAGTWLEIKDRSSPRYVVLHPAKGPASMTLSIDENDNKQFVVRLILFVRGN